MPRINLRKHSNWCHTLRQNSLGETSSSHFRSASYWLIMLYISEGFFLLCLPRLNSDRITIALEIDLLRTSNVMCGLYALITHYAAPHSKPTPHFYHGTNLTRSDNTLRCVSFKPTPLLCHKTNLAQFSAPLSGFYGVHVPWKRKREGRQSRCQTYFCNPESG